MEKQCLYTAQGEFVCTTKTRENKIENFVVEQQNMNVNTSSHQNIIGNAIEQKYCDIQIQTDSSGKTAYALKKECIK